MKREKLLLEAVGQMKNGDERGFNLLYSMTYNFVYARARQAIHDEQEVQDLMQEVYLAAYRNIGTLKDDNSLYAWLGAITMRQGAKMANKKKNQTLLSEEKQEMLEELPDERVRIEETVVNRQNAEIMRKMIEELPLEQKSTVIAYYYDGLRVEQIAEMTDTSKGTVTSRLHLARKHLRKIITEQEQREGCTLHGVNTSLVMWAIRLLLEDTRLSEAGARGIYEGICGQLNVAVKRLRYGDGGRRVSMEKLVGEPISSYAGAGKGRILRKLRDAGKMRLAVLTAGTVAVIGAGTAVGVHFNNQNQELQIQAEAEEVQKKETNADAKAAEQQLGDWKERYQKAEQLFSNLILEEQQELDLRKELDEIKKMLDRADRQEKGEEEQSKETGEKLMEEKFASAERNLEKVKKENAIFLTEREEGLYDYHTSEIEEESQISFDKLYQDYKKLFEQIKYKKANAALDELSQAITAYLDTKKEQLQAKNDVETEKEPAAENTTASNSDSDGITEPEQTVQPEAPTEPEQPAQPETPIEPEAPAEPERPKNASASWSESELSAINEIASNLVCGLIDESEARAQLVSQLPGRSCTILHYPIEQRAEMEAVVNSLDQSIYALSNMVINDETGCWLVYGK